MLDITKVSDITPEDLWEYLNPSEPYDASENNTLNTMMEVAKAYILKYTGQTDIDSEKDYVIVVFVLVQDMYDTRTLYVNPNNMNRVVESILDMHSVNLLPQEAET